MFRIIKRSLGGIKKTSFVLIVFLIAINLLTVLFNRPQVNQEKVLQGLSKKLDTTLNNPKIASMKNGKEAIMASKIFICMLVGDKCENDKTREENIRDSIATKLGQGIALVYSAPPASGIYYVLSGFENAGFVPKTYAAEGIGFAALKPIIPVWKVLRDMSYTVLVLILLAIGFMIMFRMQIDAQTVIAVENALPRIVISLLLITFSFAIAGFLIDLMYICIALFVTMLSPESKTPAEIAITQNYYLSAGPNAINAAILHSSGATGLYSLWRIGSSMISLIPNALIGWVYILVYIIALIVTARIMGISGYFTNGTNNLFGVLGGLLPALTNLGIMVWIWPLLVVLILPLIISFLVLLTIFLLYGRVFGMLFTSYLRILMLIIFSPLYMLLEAIPGQNTFKTWFLNLFAELSGFVVVVVLILVGNLITLAILEDPSKANNLNSGWDIISSNGYRFWAPPFLYGINQEAFGFIVGMGIIFIIPEIVVFVKQALGASESPFKVGVGTFFGGATTILSQGASMMGGYSSLVRNFTGDEKAAKDWAPRNALSNVWNFVRGGRNSNP